MPLELEARSNKDRAEAWSCVHEKTVLYGRLLTCTVTWAGAETCWNGQVGQVLTNMLTVDPKLWVLVVPPGEGGGKLPVNARWLAFVM